MLHEKIGDSRLRAHWPFFDLKTDATSRLRTTIDLNLNLIDIDKIAIIADWAN